MTVTLKIQGMSCQHCVNRVQKALEAVPGVTSAEVTIGKAIVIFDAAKVTQDIIQQAIKDAGYSLAV